MPTNTISITPGQALLLLIDHYKNNPMKQIKLKKLYLSGADTKNRAAYFCRVLKKEELLRQYNIVSDADSINKDPVRRYFETHLAYQTLRYGVSKIDVSDLKTLWIEAFYLVDLPSDREKLHTIRDVIDGECVKPVFNKLENYQHNAYIQRLREGTIFTEFTIENREKIIWLERIIYTSLLNGWRATQMPLDIYKTTLFSDIFRGRVKRPYADITTTRNQSFGLLKGHMPLAFYNDIARSSITFTHIKSTDYKTFNINSPLVQTCFQQLVHPFSNSISGCFLVFIRMLARIHIDHKLQPSVTDSLEDLTLLLRLIISCSLYYSGGHSLFEYAAILTIPVIQDFFQYLSESSSIRSEAPYALDVLSTTVESCVSVQNAECKLNLETIFYNDNEDAIKDTFSATIEYNAIFLKKAALHNELQQVTELIDRNLFFLNKQATTASEFFLGASCSP